MCERFGCLPSALYEEGPELIPMVFLYDTAHPGREYDETPPE